MNKDKNLDTHDPDSENDPLIQTMRHRNTKNPKTTLHPDQQRTTPSTYERSAPKASLCWHN